MAENKLAVKNKEALAFFQGVDSRAGMEDSGGESKVPYLMVVRNPDRAPLAGGGNAKAGQIYHSKLQLAWDTLDVHFTYLRGSYMWTQWDKEVKDWDRKGEQKNILLACGYIAGEERTPFVYKIQGMNYVTFINYQKEANDLIKGFNVPMYGYRTHLTTVLNKNTQGGQAWVIEPKVVRNGSLPVIEENVEFLKLYQESIALFKEKAQEIIDRNLGYDRKADEMKVVQEVAEFDEAEVVDMTGEDVKKN